MELSKQVISLEIAQRMDKLGVKGESLFKWWNKNLFYCEHMDKRTGVYQNGIPAYTVAELGEMLPHYIDEIGYISLPDRIGQGKTWFTGIAQKFADNANTEANARGLMLCYLKENNLL